MQYPTLIVSLLTLTLTTATPLTTRQTTISTDSSDPDIYTITLSRTGPHVTTPLVVTLNELTPCDDGSSPDYPSCALTALSVIPGTFRGLLADDVTVQHNGVAPEEGNVQCIGYKDVSGVIAGTARFWAGHDTSLKMSGTDVASLLCYVLPESE